jgi:hypothetical protein
MDSPTVAAEPCSGIGLERWTSECSAVTDQPRFRLQQTIPTGAMMRCFGTPSPQTSRHAEYHRRDWLSAGVGTGWNSWLALHHGAAGSEGAEGALAGRRRSLHLRRSTDDRADECEARRWKRLRRGAAREGEHTLLFPSIGARRKSTSARSRILLCDAEGEGFAVLHNCSERSRDFDLSDVLSGRHPLCSYIRNTRARGCVSRCPQRERVFGSVGRWTGGSLFGGN